MSEWSLKMRAGSVLTLQFPYRRKKSCQEQSVKTTPEIGIGAAVAGYRQNLIQIGCILFLESTDVLKIKSVRLQQN